MEGQAQAHCGVAAPRDVRDVTLLNSFEARSASRTAPTAPAAPADRTMTEAGIRVTDPLRMTFAAMACLGIFALDQATAATTSAAQLYPAALLALYGMRSRIVVGAFWLIAVVLTVAVPTILEPNRLRELAEGRALSIAIVSLIAVALVKFAEREHNLRWDALIDPLTGVFNRRSFLEFSVREEARAQRGGAGFAVLMIDIDHFKRVNDTYGHQAGDAVIKELADVATRTLRPSDILARYGGEEFVVSLPDTDYAQARVVAERLRTAIETAAVISEAGAIRFTVSIGVATCSHNQPLRDAIARADKALYAAKNAGRNRVEPGPLAMRTAEQPLDTTDTREARRILVVDDETEIRNLLAAWLEDSGYVVVSATGAADALHIIETDPTVNLLLTDVVMPGGLDGYELGRRAAALRPDLKLLFMSGFSNNDAPRNAPLLQKPFRMSHLLDSIAATLGA
jgi:diguanylate cyclase (GGDEF)-like protein